ncbi:MAG: sensor histidine kinase [Nocardioidaceae bacterium]
MTETLHMTTPLAGSPGRLHGPSRPNWRRRVLRDSGYSLSALPLAVPAFAVAVAGVSAGISLAFILLGLPVLALTAYAARGFAHLERQRLRTVLGHEVPSPQYAVPAAADGWVRRALVPLRDPQSWLDLVWAVIGLATAILATVLTITWWALAFGGLTYWFWQRFIPYGEDNVTLASLIGFGEGRAAEAWLNLAIGVFALVTLPAVMRLAATAHSSLGRVLLASRAEMQQEVYRLEAGRDAARAAEADSLRRLERDIHDGPQQRLVRLSMDLGRARKQLELDPDTARQTIDAALLQARETVDELRSLSRGIAPPVLVDRGLRAALDEVVARSSVPVESTVEVASDLPPHVETAVYFLVSEALTNVAKHANATVASVLVRQVDGAVLVRVSDNGYGGAHLSKGHGLAGLDQRVRAADGRLSITSPEGGPTTIEAEVACG